MAPATRTFTPAQRELLASRMNSKGDTQDLSKNHFTKAVLAGELDALIAGKPELLSQLPPTSLRVTDPLRLEGNIDPKATKEFVEEEKTKEKERIEYANSLKGKPKPAWHEPSATYNKNRQRQHLEQARQQSREYYLNRSSGDVSVIPLPKPYSPCSKPFEQLELMYLENMRFETRHKGKYLILQVTWEPLLDRNCSSAIVEDVQGRPQYVRYMHGQRVVGREILPNGAFIAIKEPYFTAESNKTTWHIRVDHPSDIFRLTRNSDLLPLVWKGKPFDDDEATTALGWKEDGNTAIKSRKMNDLARAVHCYTEGLACVKEEDLELKMDLLRNRALAHLELGFYDAAAADAQAAIIDASSGIDVTDRIKDLNFKAYRRAAMAMYRLSDWEKAETLVGRCLQVRPDGDDKDVRCIVKNIAARIHEQSTGEYDFAPIISDLDSQRRADVADFIKRTEVRTSHIHGRGLFATEDIALGNLIMVEKAAHVMFQGDKDFSHAFTYDSSTDQVFMNMATLWQSIARELERNPSRLPQILNLFDKDWNKDPTEGDVVDGKAIMDVFHIDKIISHNVISPPTPEKDQGDREFGFSEFAAVNEQNGGIWLRTSMINHSCLPNAIQSHIGDLVILRASRPIKRGDEIFLRYLKDPYYDLGSLDFELRQATLEGAWGFTCSCPLCTAERSDGHEVRDHRREVVAEFNGLCSEPGTKRNFNIGKVIENQASLLKIHKNIAGTYSDQLYTDVPRIEALNTGEKFKDMSYMMMPAAETYKLMTKYMGHMGWDVDFQKDKPEVVPRENSFLDRRLFYGILAAAALKEEEGEIEAKEELERIAGVMYETINGVMAGLDDIKEYMTTLKETKGKLPKRS